MKTSFRLKASVLPGIILSVSALFVILRPSASVMEMMEDPRDGQSYPLVKLGNNYWFASNLNYHSEESECFEDAEISCGEWGRLYPISEFRKVCPEDWRIPTRDDWQVLKEIIETNGIDALYQGEHWRNHENASNSTGLSLVPSGFKHKRKFLYQYLNSTIWFNDSTMEGANWHFHTDGKNNEEEYYFHTHEDEVYVRKFAVRCVCDEENLEDK